VFGAIIGVVDLVDVHLADQIGHGDGAGTAICCASPWAQTSYDDPLNRDIVHLVLENPRALPEPIKMRGALGLWTPPNDLHLEAVLRAQGAIR
jgi:hypothetical protein